MRSLFGGQQHFSDPWVGAASFNRLGGHLSRMLVSQAAASLRIARARQESPVEDAVRTLERDGVAVIEEFVDTASHCALRDEVAARLTALETQVPIPEASDRRFGARRPFQGGFDRFDGSTLNRYVDIDPRVHPLASRFVQEARLMRLVHHVIGTRLAAKKASIYLTVQGNELQNPDLQKELHRDTFQPAIKFWYFLEEVSLAQGPFEYVVGSHLLTPARLRWEYRRSVEASRRGSRDTGGSFRIDEQALQSLGLAPPRPLEVRENTLIIANVRGFHRRGHGTLGSRRVSIYGNVRPRPFVPW
ncbi:MAG TPA: phytanoyl-CoA dioxygenase family protein [Polyangiaceae bacterium]|nr:phytanoyl-CoA dioxygenase family protein [Polyangiaceae bacterium]